MLIESFDYIIFLQILTKHYKQTVNLSLEFIYGTLFGTIVTLHVICTIVTIMVPCGDLNAAAVLSFLTGNIGEC